ncbi:MAG TPA: glycosyltransferase family 4 protein [Pyrinomonadaceae bacterium]|nr:glycosyltransferase family 4 protein [Pyrinomonadaceae bacterium]HMP66297.1 glycosyltransferase family 4 protein [Pyrinomonadaceae bacterium]
MTKETGEKEIRVLLVAPILPIVGGQTVQAERLLRRLGSLPKLDVRLQPINPQFAPSLQRIKYLRTLLTWPKYLLDLLRRVRHFDVIHIFSASYLSFLISPLPALATARLFGKPTILNYRSGEAEDHLNRWRSAVPTIRRFDRIVVPSGYLVDVFARFGLEAEAIFNFVDTDRFPFRERRPLRPVFLSNRNFEAHYNVACTLRAFRLIQESIPEAALIVVGDGPERERLRRLSEELELSNVEFRGAVEPDKMAEVYDEADVYLNTSSIDNMPNSIIEAFAAGLPVVSTDAGGIPYIVENERTGLLSGLDEHEALAQNAVRLFRVPGLADGLIAAARTEVERYSWEGVQDKWVGLYRSLVSE